MNKQHDTRRWQEAHDFLQAHKGVIYHALYRLGIRRHRGDFDDWLQEATIFYINYYCSYQDARVTLTDITKFNRLAGHFVYLNLLDKVRVLQRRAEIAPLVSSDLPSGSLRDFAAPGDTQLDAERHEFYDQLLSTLHAHERDVLQLRYRGLNNTEVAATLGLSRYQIIRIMRKVQKQALLLIKTTQ